MGHNKIHIKCAGITHRGKVRPSNEDAMVMLTQAIWFKEFETLSLNIETYDDWLFAVADGIGGAKAGEVASGFVVEKLSQLKKITPSKLKAILIQLNNDLIQLGLNNTELKGLGTTVAGIGFGEDGLFAFNVGDARVYRFYKGKLVQISIDDNLAEALSDYHNFENELELAFLSNTLTQCIGGNPLSVQINPHIIQLKSEPKEKFLLCTDGLSNMVNHQTIENIVSQNEPPASIVSSLLNCALKSGGKDNITIIVVETNQVIEG